MSLTLVAAATAAGLATALVWRRTVGKPKPRRRPRRRHRPVELADLKAEGLRRIESMQGFRLTVLEAARQDVWLLLVVRVEPPTPEARWWPCGVSVECPRRLALRDSASQGPPLQGSLLRRLEQYDLETWVRGRLDLRLRVQTPPDCDSLEIGYYGRPGAVYQL